MLLASGKGTAVPGLLDRALVSVEEEGGQKKQQVFEIGQSCDELSHALEGVVCTMKVGERCRVSVGSSYALELLSLEAGRPLWELSDEERAGLAARHKAAGTQCFQEGNTAGAAMHYSRAVKYLIPIEGTDVETMATTESLKIVLFLNLSACQLRFGQYPLVVSNCTRVLTGSEAPNVKALFRRAQANIYMNDFEQARQDLLRAKQVAPGNHAVEEQLKALAAKEAAHRKHYHNALGKMFS